MSCSSPRSDVPSEDAGPSTTETPGNPQGSGGAAPVPARDTAATPETAGSGGTVDAGGTGGMGGTGGTSPVPPPDAPIDKPTPGAIDAGPPHCALTCSNFPAQCQDAVFDFDTGPPSGAVITNGEVTTTRAHSGRYSVAVGNYRQTSANGGDVDFSISLCSDGVSNLAGRTVSAWAFIDGPSVLTLNPQTTSFCNFRFKTAAGDVTAGDSSRFTTNSWFRFSWDFRQDQTATARINVRCHLLPVSSLGDPDGSKWNGTIYFDDVRFE
jgi:hypothetical protein